MAITYPVVIMDVGEIVEFTNEEIVSADIVQEINPISVELPISTFEFSVYSEDARFSIFSGGEFFSSLSKRQPMMVYENIDGTNHFMGKFYLDDWESTGQYELAFKCVDIIGVLDATKYDGGFWPTATTLEDILYEILNPLNIEYTIIDESIKSIEIKGWIPPGTYREAIQQVCFAAGVTARSARSETLNIVWTRLPINNPDNVYDMAIGEADRTMDQSVKLLPLVTSIELISHEYSKGADFRATENGDGRITEGGDERITNSIYTLVSEDIFSETLTPGFYKIVFDKPYYNVAVEGVGYVPIYRITEGGDERQTEGSESRIIPGDYEFGPNCLYLTVYEPGGEVLVTGYPWVDSKQAHKFTEADIGEGVAKNALQIPDATMISLDNAETILNRVRDYFRQRYTQNVNLFTDGADTEFYGTKNYGSGTYASVKNPRVSNTVLIDVYAGSKLLAMIEKMDFDMTGGFRTNAEVVGIEYIV